MARMARAFLMAEALCPDPGPRTPSRFPEIQHLHNNSSLCIAATRMPLRSAMRFCCVTLRRNSAKQCLNYCFYLFIFHSVRTANRLARHMQMLWTEPKAASGRDFLKPMKGNRQRRRELEEQRYLAGALSSPAAFLFGAASGTRGGSEPFNEGMNANDEAEHLDDQGTGSEPP